MWTVFGLVWNELFSLELLPLCNLPSFKALRQEKHCLWINQNPHFRLLWRKAKGITVYCTTLNWAILSFFALPCSNNNSLVEVFSILHPIGKSMYALMNNSSSCSLFPRQLFLTVNYTFEHGCEPVSNGVNFCTNQLLVHKTNKLHSVVTRDLTLIHLAIRHVCFQRGRLYLFVSYIPGNT